MAKTIQQLVIDHLMKEGSLEINLPSGMTLEFGITQEGRNGDLHIIDDYCWVIATQDSRAVSIDPYNLALRYSADSDKILIDLEDSIDYNGESVRILQCA